MGTLMPRESEVAARFDTLWKTQGIEAATNWFYALCIRSNDQSLRSSVSRLNRRQRSQIRATEFFPVF